MNQRLVAIGAKRARLIERAASERAQLAQALQSWAQPLGLVDRCIAAIRFVIAQPPLVAGAALVLVLLRPRRAFRWARRALAIWQGYRWLMQRAAG